jgi:integrase
MISSLDNKSEWRRQSRDVRSRWEFSALDDPDLVPAWSTRSDALAAADVLVVEQDRLDNDDLVFEAVLVGQHPMSPRPSGHHLDIAITRRPGTGDNNRLLVGEGQLPGRGTFPYDLREGRNNLSHRIIALDMIRAIVGDRACHIPLPVLDRVIAAIVRMGGEPGTEWTVGVADIRAIVLNHDHVLDLRNTSEAPPTERRRHPETRRQPLETPAPLVPDTPIASLTEPHIATKNGSGPLIAVLDAALDSQVVRDIKGSAAPKSWRAYRSDLTDLGHWLNGRDWTDPNVIGDYLRALEDAGAAYSTIQRRTTSIAKLVEVLAAIGHMDPAADPTKHPTARVALKAIRRRLGTDLDQAAPLTAERLIQVLLSIDATTLAGRRDIALLLIGWFGAFRRSEISGIRRGDLAIDDHGVVITLQRSKASQEHAVIVPIARTPESRWCPVDALEQWLTGLDALADATDVVWPWITRGDNLRTGIPPVGDAAIDGVVTRRVTAAGVADSADYSAHSLRSGWITEAKNRRIDEADIMRHARLKSLSIMRSYDRRTGWWNRNPTAGTSL